MQERGIILEEHCMGIDPAAYACNVAFFENHCICAKNRRLGFDSRCKQSLNPEVDSFSVLVARCCP